MLEENHCSGASSEEKKTEKMVTSENTVPFLSETVEKTVTVDINAERDATDRTCTSEMEERFALSRDLEQVANLEALNLSEETISQPTQDISFRDVATTSEVLPKDLFEIVSFELKPSEGIKIQKEDETSGVILQKQSDIDHKRNGDFSPEHSYPTDQVVVFKGIEDISLGTSLLRDRDTSSESIGKTVGTSVSLETSSSQEQVSRFSSNEDEKPETPSRKSSANKSESSRPSSRPASRRSDRSQPSSRPTSRRTDRASTNKPEAPHGVSMLPPVSRHKRKNLETSPAMLELFGVHVTNESFEIETNRYKKQKEDTTPKSNAMHRDIKFAEKVDPFQIQKYSGGGTRLKRGRKHRNLFERTEFNEPGPELAADIDSSINQTNVSSNTVGGTREQSAEVLGTFVEIDGVLGKHKKLSLQHDAHDGYDRVANNEAKKIRRASEPGPEYYDFKDDIESIGSGKISLGDKSNVLHNQAIDGEANSERNSSGLTAVRDVDIKSAQSGISTNSCASEPARDMSAPTGSTASAIVIKGAQVVNDDSIFCADVLIEDNIIKQVSTHLSVPVGTTVIDANGKLLLPAGIDVHTHFSTPNCVDNFQVGSKAALAGGTATVIDAVVPREGESLLGAYDRARKTAEAHALCNFGLSVVVLKWNETIKKEMSLLAKDKGVNSFIIDIHTDDDLYQAFEHCKTLGVLARVFPENKNIVSLLEKKMLALGVTGPEGYLQARPEMLEAEYIDRASIVAQLTNCPLSVVGVSSIEARNAIMRSRSNSLLFPEVAVAALASDGTHYFNRCLQHASAHLTKSPLRVDPRTSSLLVDCFASCPLCVCVSDHCGYRERGTGDFTHLAVGVAAAEERMSILWEKAVYSGRIDPMRFVAITSSNAAKMFNLYPKKGRIAVGADADLVIWDANMKKKFSAKTQQSRSEFSIFESQFVHSGPVITICGGRVAFNSGKFEIERGSFVPLMPQSPYMFSVIQQRDKLTSAEKVNRDDQSNGLPKSRDSSATRTPVVARNQFESSLSPSGSHMDEGRAVRASTKIINPPGGRSTAFW